MPKQKRSGVCQTSSARLRSLADEGLQSGLRTHFLELLTSAGRDLPDLIPSGIVWYDLDPLW